MVKKIAARKKASTPPLTDHAEREINARYENYTEWIKEQTGYDPDPLSLQLAVTLYPRFQKSDANKSLRAELDEAREAREAEREEKRQEREAKRAEREAKKAARAAKKSAPAKASKKAPAKKAAASTDEVAERRAAKKTTKKAARKPARKTSATAPF